jgi:hypothetical protein
MQALTLYHVLNAIDRIEPGADPSTWTIDGEPLTPRQLHDSASHR